MKMGIHTTEHTHSLYSFYVLSYTLQVPLAFFWHIAAATKQALPARMVTPLHTIGA
jgi:hypothetical protein